MFKQTTVNVSVPQNITSQVINFYCSKVIMQLGIHH